MAETDQLRAELRDARQEARALRRALHEMQLRYGKLRAEQIKAKHDDPNRQ
jgi:hypothetical protein